MGLLLVVMVFFMKNKFFIWVILIAILIIALLTFFIQTISPKLDNNSIKQSNLVDSNTTSKNLESVHFADESLSTSYSRISLSPNAELSFIKHYSICGHSIKTIEKISNEMVNLDFDNFSKLYSDWNISKFESNYVELTKEISGYCGEHYIVKDLNGIIAVYLLDMNNNLSLLRQTEIITKYLPEGDVKDLCDGVVIYGKDNLNAYLENFE